MLTTSTTDLLIGVGAADQFSGTSTTDDLTDIIVDAVAGDNDTLTLTATASVPTVRTINVENIAVTINSLAADTVDAANFSSVEELSVTRGDVTVGGATLTGNKTVRIDNVDASQIAAISVGARTTDVDFNSASTDAAGHIVNIDSATGAVTVDGAATVNAAAAASVANDAVSNTNVAQTGKTTTINAAVATTVTTHANLTGSVVINAAKATTLTVNDAQGGVVINAATAHTADSTITVTDVDSSGATIVVGTGADDSTTTSNIGLDIVLRGTAATTDTASISAAGYIELDIDGTAAEQNIDHLTLSGNGAAVVYNLAAPATGTAVSFTKSGSQSVEIIGDSSEFSGITITNIDVIDVAAGGSAAFDASLFSGVGVIDLGVSIGNNAITVVSGQTVEITADQTTTTNFDFSSAGGGNLTIIAGDDNGTSTSVGTINLVALNAAAASATTVGTVTIEASISNVDAEGVTLGAAQTLVITGDEDVTLSDLASAETVTAAAVDASGSSGIITINVEDSGGAATVAVITTGSGADAIQVDTVSAMTVSSGAGNDAITIEDAGASSVFDAGAGNDTVNVDSVAQVVVVGGAGNDNFTTALNIGGTIIGGDGEDTITIDAAGARTFASTFSFNGIEELDITAAGAAVSMTGAQLAANPTLIIDGNGTDDVFNVNTGSTATAARSADLSNVTIKTGATASITVTGGVGVDTITGGVASETFTQTLGADSIEGGGTTNADTYVAVTSLDEDGASPASAGSIVNLGDTSVTSASVFSATGAYISGNLTEVISGKVGYIFSTNATANSAVLDTVGGIENVTGSAGIDYIVGTSGNNVILGMAGADYINGGAGNDTITGGTGIDTLVGGDGADTFDFSTVVLAANASNITDFDATSGGAIVDVLKFDAATFTAYTAGTAVAIVDAGDITDANSIIIDTAANIITAAVNTTNGDAVVFIDSATGNIYYDANGDFAAGAIIIGSITAGEVASLAVGNFLIA